MKILLSKSLDLEPLEESMKFLGAYSRGSQQMPARYKKPETVRKLLAPLYNLVPLESRHLPKIVYRVGNFKTKSTQFALKSKSVVSWTTYDSEKKWLQIIEDVGIDDRHGPVLAVRAMPPRSHFLTSPAWITEVQKKLRPHAKKSWTVRLFLDDVSPKWQGEAILTGAQLTVQVAGHFQVTDEEPYWRLE